MQNPASSTALVSIKTSHRGSGQIVGCRPSLCSQAGTVRLLKALLCLSFWNHLFHGMTNHWERKLYVAIWSVQENKFYLCFSADIDILGQFFLFWTVQGLNWPKKLLQSYHFLISRNRVWSASETVSEVNHANVLLFSNEALFPELIYLEGLRLLRGQEVFPGAGPWYPVLLMTNLAA